MCRSDEFLDSKNIMNREDANLYGRVINLEETSGDEKTAAQTCMCSLLHVALNSVGSVSVAITLVLLSDD